MLPKRTVFVIGAGAGCDVGMPVGSKLAAQISKLLSLTKGGSARSVRIGDQSIWETVCGRSDINALAAAALHISEGIQTADSIDDFIDRAKDGPNGSAIELCGKFGIVRAILDAERHSDLHVDTSNARNKLDLNAIAHTWFMKLLRLLTRNQRDASRLFENITFINFNYDRCLEHFFLHALPASYTMPSAEAQDIVRSAQIFHPYGKVGGLPDMPGTSSAVIPFGDDGSNYLASLASQISTYTEQVADGQLVQQVRDALNNAERVIFLGFHYHKQNMDLITPEDPPADMGRQFFGTALGFSDQDLSIVRRYMLRFFAENRRSLVKDGQHLHMRSDLKCDQLFDVYGRTFANA